VEHPDVQLTGERPTDRLRRAPEAFARRSDVLEVPSDARKHHEDNLSRHLEHGDCSSSERPNAKLGRRVDSQPLEIDTCFSVVTSIRALAGIIGVGVPATTAILVYWLTGRSPTGIAGVLLVIALLGIPIGPLIGGAYAPWALVTTRPILLAGHATVLAVFIGVIGFTAYTIIDATRGGTGIGLDEVLGYSMFVSVAAPAAWAFATPFTLLGVVLLRRHGRAGVSLQRAVPAAIVLAVAGVVTALDAISHLGA
jgi:hypothetical protein